MNQGKGIVLLLMLFLSSISFAQEVCNNGKDDDGDGMVDCYDTECIGDASCANFFIGPPASCKFVPSGGQPFTLTVDWQTSDTDINATMDSRQTPVVGDVDNDGMPEVIGMADNGDNLPGMKIFSGLDGSLEATIAIPGGVTQHIGTPSFGDIDGDGYAEIFCVSADRRLVRVGYDGATWSVEANTAADVVGYASNSDRLATGMADFDCNDTAEVYCSNQIFNSFTLAKICEGGSGGGAGGVMAIGAYGPSSGQSAANREEAFSVAIDVLDSSAACPQCGGLELVAGNMVYYVDIAGAAMDSQVVAPAGLEDGITSVADIDKDGDLDGIINTGGSVYFWDLQTSTQIYNTLGFAGNAGGRATVADFDNDGYPEVGIAAQNLYVFIDTVAVNTIGIKASVGADDGSQRTGSTVYDFEGDGVNEIVYRDEDSLYLYQLVGNSVQTLATIECPAGTRMEYPLVADVDADDGTEIICTCQEAEGPGVSGDDWIVAFRAQDKPWIKARKIWNQHGFHSVNINDDLTIPRQMSAGHLVADSNTLNSFLAQSTFITGAGGAQFAAPDPAVSIEDPVTDVDLSRCAGFNEIIVRMKINNYGSATLPNGMPMSYYDGDPFSGGTLLGTGILDTTLAANDSLYFIDTIPGIGGIIDFFIATNHDGVGVPFSTSIGDCDTSNNFWNGQFNGCSFIIALDDALIIDEEETDSAWVGGNDAVPLGNSYSGIILTGAMNGTATLLGDTLIEYVPNNNFNGVDSVIYEICDIATPTLCDTATLYITVNSINDKPIANDTTVTINEDDPVANYLVTNNDTDVDGNLDTSSVTILSGPTGSGSTASFVGAGQIQYTPGFNFNGVDSIQYRVCDDSSSCDTAWFFINVTAVPDNPIANPDTLSVDEDGLLTNINVSADDIDYDGDLNLASVSVISGPTGTGSTAVPDGAGGIDYTPGLNFNGVDTIVYQICDGQPACDSDTLFVLVASKNDKPVANDDNESVLEDASVTNFNVSSNDTDVDGNLDATTVTIISGPTNAGSSAIVDGIGGVDYTPESDYFGVDSVQYSICDDSSACDTAWLIVTVNSVLDNPVANTDNTTVPEDTTTVNISLSANDTDGDGDLDPSSVTILSGPTATGSIALVDGVGGVNYSPGLNFNGIDTIVYQICDGQPVCDSDTLFVTVTPVDDAPQAVDDPTSFQQGQIDTTDVSANDSDVDGNLDPTSVTIISGPNTAGATANVDGAGGIIVDYTGAVSFVGADTVEYRICDATALCDTAYLLIDATAGNSPVTTTDTITILEDATLTTIDVAANDSDPDGNLDTSSVTILSGPTGTGSTATPGGNGTIDYTPGLHFNGTDTIIYQICDITLLCSSDTLFVSVTPVDDPPDAIVDFGGVAQGNSNTINVSSNDTDPDGNLNVGSVTILSGPNVVGALGSTDGAGGIVIDYSGAPAFTGVDTVVYQICDSTPLCDSDTLFITVSTGNPPVATADTIIVNEDDSLTISVIANDTDADNNINLAGVTVVYGPNSTGSTATPDTTGSIKYVPGPNFNGTDTIVYQVCDSTFLCDTDTIWVTVNPIDDTPVILDSLNNPLDTLTISTTDTVPTQICFNNIQEVDGDSVDISSAISGPTNGVLTGIGTGDTCFTYTANLGFTGTDTVSVTVCDDGGGTCDTIVVLINVTLSPKPPVIHDGSSTPVDTVSATTTEDVDVFIPIPTLDANGDSVDVVAILNGPSSGIVVGTSDADTAVNYTPNQNFNGTDQFDVVSCDNTGLCDTATVIVTVTPVDDPPVIVDTSGSPITVLNTTTIQDTPVQICFTVTEVDGQTVDVTNAFNGPANGAVSGLSTGDTCFTYTPNTGFTGQDTVLILACDGGATCDSVNVIISVVPATNNPPIIQDTSGAPLTVISDTTPENTSINIPLNAIDPDGDTIDVTSIINGPFNGSITGLSTGDTTFTYTPNTSFNGTDSMQALVCDVWNACDTVLVRIVVTAVSNPPDAVTDSVTITQTDTAIVNVLFNDTDADNDIDTSSVAIISGPGSGATTSITNGVISIDYSGVGAFTGFDTVVYQVCDMTTPVALCDSDTIFVAVSPAANNSPQILDTSGAPTDTLVFTVFEDSVSSLVFSVTDPDVDPVDINGVFNGPSFAVIGGAGDGDTTISYSPNLNYFGADTFNVIACDIWNACDTALVIVNVTNVNDTPVITDGSGTPTDSGSTTTIINTPVVICVNATDDDGDLVEATSLACGPLAGNVTGLSSGVLCITYTPNPGFTGNDVICIVVCDPSGACDTIVQSISVIPFNNSPVVTDTLSNPADTLSFTTNQNTAINICINATDADGDSVEISGALSGPSDGLASGYGNGLCFTYTPDSTFLGTDTISLLVCDDGSPVACDTVTIVIGVVPVGASNSSPIVLPDSTTMTSNGSVNVAVLLNDTDPDSNLNAGSVTVITSASNGTTVVNIDGTITYTPNPGFTGVDTFKYQVCDNFAIPACGDALVTITVNALVGVTVSNFVSANNDGINDNFIINGIENYPQNTVRIFNRWGNTVYLQDGYDSNDPLKSWNGNSNKGITIGKELPDGTYFYIIELNDADQTTMTGYIVLTR